MTRGGNRKKSGRPFLPSDKKRKKWSITLQPWVLETLRARFGRMGMCRAVEKAVINYYELTKKEN